MDGVNGSGGDEAAVLSRLIGLIYDCALDPGRWEGTLLEIRRSFGFSNAMFTIWTMPGGHVVFNVMSGVEPAYQQRLMEFGPAIVEQWGGPDRINGFAVGEPKVLSWERPRAEWTDCAYYREWVEPQGIVDMMAVAVTRDSGTYCSVGMARHESAGAITEREVHLVRLLVPHIQRAVAISRILDIKTIEASTFAATLDAVASPILLVDDELRIVSRNIAAQRLLATGDPIHLERGALSLRSAASAQALRLAVRQAGTDEAAIGRRGIGIPAMRLDGEPSLLHVLPLRRGSVRRGLAPSAAAAIFVASASGPLPATDAAMALLFDLTPAESRVFSAITSGMTVAETAHALGVGLATVKTHLLRLFAKTGTGRQADLVKLACSLAMPL